MDIPSDSDDGWIDSDDDTVQETEDDDAEYDDIDDDEIAPPIPPRSWMPSASTNFDSSKYDFAGNRPPQMFLPGGSDPMTYFKYLLTDQILEDIVRESNLFASQKDPAIDLQLTKDELLKFIGTVLYMSCVKIPNTRYYWSSDVGQEPIKRAFCINRWERIKNNIHFSDNATAPPRTDPNYDRSYKIRPFLDSLRERFMSIPMEENLCVDEQMIPTKVLHHSN